MLTHLPERHIVLLMTTNNFRTIALALRSYVGDTYNLLHAADAVEAILPELQAIQANPLPFIDRMGASGSDEVNLLYPHETLVARALDSKEVLFQVGESRKINAIKHLRNITGCGLKAAKDAVEDQRVLHAGHSQYNPF